MQEKKVDDLSLAEVAAAIPRRTDDRCAGCDDGKCPGKVLAPAYIMAHSADGRKRRSSVPSSRWLVVDWDATELPPLETEHIAVPSHRGRWHLLIRLARAASPEEYRATADAFARRWGGASDPRTRNIDRALYAPHRGATPRIGGVGYLPVEKPLLGPATARELPITRKTPSKRFREQWVSAMVSSTHGNNQLAGALGGVLARHCGFTNEEIAATMQAWLGGADPRFDKHVNDALRGADSARAGSPVPGLPRLAELGIEFSLDDDWPDIEADGALDAVFGARWTGADIEMAPVPAIAWVSERWAIAPGAPVVLAGAGGLGKTLLAQALALAVATPGGSWLGEPMPTGRVVHIDHEQGLIATRRRYQRLGINGAAGLELRCPPAKGWRLSSERGLEWLERVAEGARLVILDSLRASTPGVDENDSDIRTLLDPLGDVAARTGAAVLVIHHARKQGENAVEGPEFLRGSSGITDAASAVIGLARRGESVDMWLAKIRDPGPGTHGLFVRHSITFRNDEHGGLHIESLESRASALQIIAGLPDGLTTREIDAAVDGMRNQDKRRHYYDTHPNTQPRKRTFD